MKRGQEEIVGFVVIIVFVAIVGLVFLSLSLRKGNPQIQESTDVYQFLESFMEVSTQCSLTTAPDYAKFKEALGACYSGVRCADGGDPCDIVNGSLSIGLSSAWKIDSDSQIRGYDFSSVYVLDQNEKKFFALRSGNCNGTLRGSEYLIPASPGRIVAGLNICY